MTQRIKCIFVALLCLVSGLLMANPTRDRASQQDVKTDLVAIKKEVEQVELAFAATLAKRDWAAFSGFIADDAMFITGKKVLQGKAQILAGWEHFFEDAIAPFSWKPDEIEVLSSGRLASSSGSVFDAKGVQIARYISIWRKDGKRWRIVMDRGVDICRCEKDTKNSNGS